MEKIACRIDWKNLPMPTETTSLLVNLTFDETESAQLFAGQIPEVMEDKWFIFYEEPWLHLHRSWTGCYIYKVKFDRDGNLYRVAEVVANRDSQQYRQTSDPQDILTVDYLTFQSRRS